MIVVGVKLNDRFGYTQLTLAPELDGNYPDNYIEAVALRIVTETDKPVRVRDTIDTFPDPPMWKARDPMSENIPLSVYDGETCCEHPENWEGIV